MTWEHENALTTGWFEPVEPRLLLAGTDAAFVQAADGGPLAEEHHVLTPGTRSGQWRFLDADGDLVAVVFGGRSGSVDIIRAVAPEQQGDITGIVIDRTDDRSSVSIFVYPMTLNKVAGTTIGSITVNGSLGTFQAPAADMVGDIRVSGTLGALTMRDVAAGGHTLSVAGQARTRAMILQFANVNDLVVHSLQWPISRLTANAWTNGASADEGIQTTWIGQITVAGDFCSNLQLAGGASSTTLGRVSIGGDLSQSNWTVAGKLTALAVGGQVTDTVLTVQGALGQLTTRQWTGGALSARSITNMSITGGAGLNGDFDVPLTITGQGLARGGKAAASVAIAGDVVGSNWSLAGSVASIRVAGTVDEWTCYNLTSLASLQLGDVTRADVVVTGALTVVSASRWLNGSLRAGMIGSLTTTGAGAAVPGDFGARLELSGTRVDLGKAQIAGSVTGGYWALAGSCGTVSAEAIAPVWEAVIAGSLTAMTTVLDLSGRLTARTIGSLTVGRDMDHAVVTLTNTKAAPAALGQVTVGQWMKGETEIRSAGPIGAVSAGGIQYTRIFSGAKESTYLLPADGYDFVGEGLASGAGRIDSLTVRGILSLAPGDPLFVASVVSAWSIGSAAVRNVDTSTGDPKDPATGLFGFAAASLGAFSRSEGGETIAWQSSPANPWPVNMDYGQFAVRNLTTAVAVDYVDGAAGNDANDGATPGTPWQTIQHALDSVGPGLHRIYVRGGQSYSETQNGYLHIKSAEAGQTWDRFEIVGCDSNWRPVNDPAQGPVLTTADPTYTIRNNWHQGGTFTIRGFWIAPEQPTTSSVFQWEGSSTVGDLSLTIDHCYISLPDLANTQGVLSSFGYSDPTRALTVTDSTIFAPGSASLGVNSWDKVFVSGDTITGGGPGDVLLRLEGTVHTVIAHDNTVLAGGEFVRASGVTDNAIWATISHNTVTLCGPSGIGMGGYSTGQTGARLVIEGNIITMNARQDVVRDMSAIGIGGNVGYSANPYGVIRVVGNTIRVADVLGYAGHGITVQDRAVGAVVADNDIAPTVPDGANQTSLRYGLAVLATRADVYDNTVVAAYPLVVYLARYSHYTHNVLRIGGALPANTWTAGITIGSGNGAILAENCVITDNLVDASKGNYAVRFDGFTELTRVTRSDCWIVPLTGTVATILDLSGQGWPGVANKDGGGTDGGGDWVIYTAPSGKEIRGFVLAGPGGSNLLWVMFETPVATAKGVTIRTGAPHYGPESIGYRRQRIDRNTYVAGTDGLAMYRGVIYTALADLAGAWAAGPDAWVDNESHSSLA